MPYRIIQWGTGNVGKHALRTIVERPDFELVGLRVYNPGKVGRDAGELLGRAPVGVVATDDADAILALDADCVCYTPLGTTLGDDDGPLEDICRLLRSGKNVVSSAVEYHAYLRPGTGPQKSRAARDRIVAACEEGGTAFFHVGINPGFAMDLWPMVLSRVSRRIDRLTAIEIVDMSTYPSPHMVVDALGFGKPAGFDSAFDILMRDVNESPFWVSMLMLADAIGVDLDGGRYHREVALAERDFDIAAGTVAAGTVAATRLHLDGMRKGEVAIAFEWVWRVTDEVGTDWPTGASRWIVRIDGDPQVESELTLATSEDAGRATSLAVATLALNAVPSVCAAPAGPLDNLTLTPHGGGYFV
jgi:hypothetical protein